LGEAPLGIASGITPENVEEYLPLADCFLVATGIIRSFSQLDLTRVRLLIERVRSYNG
jgi:predicted TIM-barrel enzyme